jgi:hypothetical protein
MATPCSQRPSAAAPGVPGIPDTHCAVQPGRQSLARRLLQADSMHPARLARRLREAGVAASRAAIRYRGWRAVAKPGAEGMDVNQWRQKRHRQKSHHLTMMALLRPGRERSGAVGSL